jgi:hypothetical protein
MPLPRRIRPTLLGGAVVKVATREDQTEADDALIVSCRRPIPISPVGTPTHLAAEFFITGSAAFQFDGKPSARSHTTCGGAYCIPPRALRRQGVATEWPSGFNIRSSCALWISSLTRRAGRGAHGRALRRENHARGPILTHPGSVRWVLSTAQPSRLRLRAGMPCRRRSACHVGKRPLAQASPTGQ